MIINLISNPRNISTAMMYSFAQRKDTLVVDEPFYAYYLRISPVLHPGREEVLAAMEQNPDKILEDIVQKATLKAVLFIKNMAHHLIEMDLDFLFQYKNLFLIRNPKQLIASLAQNYERPVMSDIGLQKQYELFHFLTEKNGIAPIVLDSGELLKDPPTMLKKLCLALAIPFDEQMLTWEAGARPEDGVWAKYWYKNVHHSTGFSPQKTSTRPLPENCQALYEASLPYYAFLYEKSLKFDG